jgi:hypothetical protein
LREILQAIDEEEERENIRCAIMELKWYGCDLRGTVTSDT